MKRVYWGLLALFVCAFIGLLSWPGIGLAQSGIQVRAASVQERLVSDPAYLRAQAFSLTDAGKAAAAQNPTSDSPAQVASTQAAPQYTYDYITVYEQYTTGANRFIIRMENTSVDNVLVNGPGNSYDPRLNLDGNKVLFINDREGQFDIYQIPAAGGSPVAVTSSAENESSPYWAPDGLQVVFSRYVNGDWEIYKKNLTNNVLTRLTTSPGADLYPSWSRDGRKIAFASNRSGVFLIYTMDIDGSNVTAINPGGHYSARPFWSHDGSQIAFDADYDLDGFQELYKINVDGSGLTLLADGSASLKDTLASDWTYNNYLIYFTEVTWIYYNNQWYWTNSVIQGVYGAPPVNPAAPADVQTNGYTDWNLSTAPLERIPPVGSITPAVYNYLAVGSGAVQPYAFYLQLGASDASGIGGAWLEYQEAGQAGWTLLCKELPPYGTYYNSCSAQTPFVGLGGHSYTFRLRLMDRHGNFSVDTPGTTLQTYTIESDPPRSWWNHTLSPYTRGRSAALDIYMEDPVVNGVTSREKRLNGEYQKDGGPWVPFNYSNTQDSRTFTGQPGHTYCFRFQAVDNALNVEPFGPVTPDHCTTFYDWKINGSAMDNRGTLLESFDFQTSPAYTDSLKLDQTGVYTYFLGFPQNLLSASIQTSVGGAGYGTLPVTTFSSDSDARLDLVLPPQDDQILNGHFENGLNGWLTSGAVFTAGAHTGAAGLSLGQNLFHTSEFTSTDSLVEAAAGPLGDLHLLKAHHQGNTSQVAYQRCDAGGCDPLELISVPTTQVQGYKIQTDSQGNLFACWIEWPTGGSMTALTAEKPLGGAWSAPQSWGTAEACELLYDNQDNLLMVLSGTSVVNARYLHVRPAGGAWQAVQQVPKGLDNNGYQLTLAPEGGFYMVWVADNNPKVSTGIYAFYYAVWRPQSGWLQSKVWGSVESKPMRVTVQRHPGDTFDTLYTFLERKTESMWETYLFAEYELDSTVRFTNSFFVTVQMQSPMFEHLISPNGTRYTFTLVNGLINYYREIAPYSWTPVAVLPGVSQVIYLSANTRYTTPILEWAELHNGVVSLYYCPVGDQGCTTPWKVMSFNAVNNISWALAGKSYFGTVSGTPAYMVRYQSQAFEVGTFGSSGNQLSTANQQVTIPTSLDNPTLSLLYRLAGVDAVPTFTLTLSSRPTISAPITSTVLFSANTASTNWQHAWSDLTPWAGQTVTLTLQARTPSNGLLAAVSLDDVTLGSNLPNLRLTGATTASLLPGETGIFTLTVQNTGSLPVNGAQITVTLPVGLEFAPVGTQPQTGSSQSWSLGRLAGGAEAQVQFMVIQNRPPFILTRLEITAVLGMPRQDPNPADDTQVIVIWQGTRRLYVPAMKR